MDQQQQDPDVKTLAEQLAAALTTWATRDDTTPQPEVRKAGGTAVELIDQMLTSLHQARQTLVGEIHQSDDANMRRSGELLDRIRRERAAKRHHPDCEDPLCTDDGCRPSPEDW